MSTGWCWQAVVSQGIWQTATDGLSHPDRTLMLSVPTTRIYSPCHRTYTICIINSALLRPAILHKFRLYSPCRKTYTICIINSVLLRPATLHKFHLYSPCHRTYTICIINSAWLWPAILHKFRIYSPCHRTYTTCTMCFNETSNLTQIPSILSLP
jgi:hypothetical protein